MVNPPTNPAIKPPFKVFITAPSDFWLTPNQQAIKRQLLDKLRADGFEPQLMGEYGMPYTRSKIWNFERAQNVVQCCQGIVVLGLPLWYRAVGIHDEKVKSEANLITEYSHFEGALAFTQHLPSLVLVGDGVPERGILHPSQNTLVTIPPLADGTFVAQDQYFNDAYDLWSQKVKDRYHLFFGYSGEAAKTAKRFISALRKRGIRVRDWQDFRGAGSIMEQIEEADQTCLGGMFLFTKDDDLTSKSTMYQAPSSLSERAIKDGLMG